MRDYRVSIDFHERTVGFHGVTFGHGIRSTLLLWDFNQRSGVVVVKKPGATEWAGIGYSKYYPAQFMILKITEELSDTEYRTELIAEFDIKRGPIDPPA